MGWKPPRDRFFAEPPSAGLTPSGQNGGEAEETPLNEESGGEKDIPRRPETGRQTPQARYTVQYRAGKSTDNSVSALMKEIGKLLGWGM